MSQVGLEQIKIRLDIRKKMVHAPTLHLHPCRAVECMHDRKNINLSIWLGITIAGSLHNMTTTKTSENNDYFNYTARIACIMHQSRTLANVQCMCLVLNTKE